MSFTSWGMFPKIKNTLLQFSSKNSLKNILENNNELIPCGNGRSYGDSALNTTIVDVKPHDYFIDFNDETGLLHVQAGVLLSEILEAFVQRGWFLSVTPGTKYITVGGAIASDVHGKNHHVSGCFSEFVKEFQIMQADGNIITCSKESTPELFKASCGGMGLTGIILTAKIHLKKIESKYIDQITIKTSNLKETFEVFEQQNEQSYSVAWIDCFAKKTEIGKSLVMLGDFRKDGQLHYKPTKKLSIPFNCPSFVLNKWSIKVFNWLYYRKVKTKISKKRVDIDTFFYPLDAIGHWNRIYGKKGFTQYQFILPKETSFQGLEEILTLISESGKGSFLAVLKLYGKANDNYLSFPLEGYSLAVDFKIEKGVFDFLDKLDELVIKYKGRIYLAKDVRVNKENFEKGYPKVGEFREFRKKNQLDDKFQSLQSKRIGI